MTRNGDARLEGPDRHDRLRHRSAAEPRPFRVGTWRVDPAAREISDGTHQRKLSPRAMAALELLAAAGGDVVSRAVFLDTIWPNVCVTEESVTTALSELRRAFGETRGSRRIIETVQKSGYRLTVQIAFDDDPSRLGESDDRFHLDAYTLIQEARRLRERGERDHFERADDLCLEARRMAPDFALAHAQHALALCFRQLYRGGGIDLSEAAEIAQNGRRLRPDLAFCHAAEGYALYALQNYDDARRAFGRAVATDPNDFEAHFVAGCGLHAMGDWRPAAAIAERAAMVRPSDYQMLAIAARSSEALGDRSRALINANMALARVETRLAMDASEPRAHFAKTFLLAMTGRNAEDAINRTDDSQAGWAVGFYRVLALAGIGAVPDALDQLDEIIDLGWRHGDMLQAESMLDPLRREQRFQAIQTSLAA
ncbi:MAG: winged helix-turn-helix domain-containing protein [Pseudomonadota bacterium]